ncbi:NAD(P)H-binding protein [Streptomyces sp. SID5910]|uniref:SDR family oxidoreductase n=1 Tax=Streptomyces sp. SID5910 TaxID=2690312 RepID=UPI001367F2AD|nr:NAD(P)H-binding protein [Streptomyces sp. SID5910]MYR46957.1 NAD(P)H-binding protein [Streptomyces sp. SID5910]
MTVLVTGARGRVGRAVLHRLGDAGVPVRAASATAEADPAGGEPPVHLDLDDPDTFPAALKGIRRVFLYARPGTAERFVREAADAGVEHVALLSSLAIDADDAQDSPIARLHLEVEEALRASALSWTFVRPGAFATNALQWAAPIRAGRSVRLAYPDTYSEPVHEGDLADVAVRALLDDAHRGAVLRITGPESLSARRQAELIGQAAGVRVAVERIGREEQRAQLAAVLPEAFADTMLTYQEQRDGRPGTPLPDAERVLGRSTVSFAAWAREHAAAFR